MFNWKPYYRHELKLPSAHRFLSDSFAYAEEQAPLEPFIEAGSILSFPHTALHYAGPLQARVVVGLRRAGIRRIILLGVLHAWGHAASSVAYKTAMSDQEQPSQRIAAFDRLKGAFVSDDSVYQTPFGRVPFASITTPYAPSIRGDDEGLLKDEFSLDTFMSLLSFYYQLHGEQPPAVTPLYIGMTRNPVTDSFEVASQVASSIKEMLSPTTAIVATGDLVHYGTAYTPKERMEGMPEDREGLTKYFRREVEKTLHLALTERTYGEAFNRCNVLLNNDQRYLLPVVAEALADSAGYEILSFDFSDYTKILSTAPPCVVVSALVAYTTNPEGGVQQ